MEQLNDANLYESPQLMEIIEPYQGLDVGLRIQGIVVSI